MVKRAITISLLFVILFGVAIYELIAVHSIINTLEQYAYNLQTEITLNKDNVETVSNNVKDAKDYWNSKEDALCLMFNHKDLSTVTDTLNRLYSYVSNNDYDNAIAEVNLLKEYSEKNKHIMGFNFQNLL